MPTGPSGANLLDPLLEGRESPVADIEEKRIVEALFRPSDVGTGNNWPPPFCREFILRSRNGAGGRLYAELRRNHLRLATTHVIPFQ